MAIVQRPVIDHFVTRRADFILDTHMPTPFEEFVEEQLQENSIGLLGITPAHTGIVATLPFYHRDPFDRLIIAQSLSEGFPVIGKDEAFDDYGIRRHW